MGRSPAACSITAADAVAVLVPLDFVLIALMHERGFTTESLGPVGLFLFVEATVVAVLCRTAESGLPSAAHPRHLAATITLPNYTLVIFAAAAAFLLIRFLLIRKPVESALLWTLSAFFLSLHFATNPRLATLYAATAACILFASVIESSYLLAYHDELTTLPSRRAFNDAMQRLQQPYSIAVVDIDHFKKFNDTYGHDTGDQVLRLVASNLARVTGGGRAYRCGGEEFNILFPGKNTPDVLDHLERLRENIEASEFRLRGHDRRARATRSGPPHGSHSPPHHQGTSHSRSGPATRPDPRIDFGHGEYRSGQFGKKAIRSRCGPASRRQSSLPRQSQRQESRGDSHSPAQGWRKSRGNRLINLN